MPRTADRLWAVVGSASSFIALYLPLLIVSFHTQTMWKIPPHPTHTHTHPPCLPINWIMSLMSCTFWGKLWFVSVDIRGFTAALHFQIAKWNIDITAFTQYQCSLHTEAEWVWRTLKLDSVVTTRVHQPLSYLQIINHFWYAGGTVIYFYFLHHTEWFILSPGSSKVWVLERKHAESVFSSICTGCATPLWRALCGWQDPAEAV